jgi:hypothetical protein
MVEKELDAIERVERSKKQEEDGVKSGKVEDGSEMSGKHAEYG